MANNVNEKVRIPKEVAEAIEYFREIGWSSPSIVNIYEYLYLTGVRKYKECSHFLANNYRHIIGKFIENRIERQELFIRAVIDGYEIEQPPKKITLELTLEELGYIICDMEVACVGEAEGAANERGINYNWRDCDSLYRRLINLYEEEARV
ncbi:DUF1642 domain-containing protein [Aneurinibacillus migulanus]|uniref:DUF1642 domain-containing protein n=1 Tax=Aneurinibacillus migulanus TaxID=47500 RepID=UPI0020A05EDB|nr:DUF1642 domain-containing protein [Aneurinibacillus migulanus]MCP1354629.1 DUF1642 domain-containing protein [Aneurinibacillus migulanus]